MLIKLELLDTILAKFRNELGSDYEAYQNHLYRLVNLCNCAGELNEQDLEKVIIAACFHDLAIWSDKTFDYLDPSNQRALEYLESKGKSELAEDVSAMIMEHHKVTRFGENDSLVELFRQADWCEVSLGLLNFSFPRADVKAIKKQFPSKGFHLVLVRETTKQLFKDPLRPMPMFKW